MDADAEGDNERMDEDADGYKTGGNNDEDEDSNKGEDDGDGFLETSNMEYENWEEKGREGLCVPCSWTAVIYTNVYTCCTAMKQLFCELSDSGRWPNFKNLPNLQAKHS